MARYTREEHSSFGTVEQRLENLKREYINYGPTDGVASRLEEVAEAVREEISLSNKNKQAELPVPGTYLVHARTGELHVVLHINNALTKAISALGADSFCTAAIAAGYDTNYLGVFCLADITTGYLEVLPKGTQLVVTV